MLIFFRDEPYTLSEIRQILDDQSSKPISILTVIERHHDFLEESIPVLMDKVAPIDEKQHHLTRFFHLYEMHAKAEAETLYQALLEASEREAHVEAMVGFDEHAMADQLIAELQDSDYQSYWSEEVDAKAKVLAVLMENHLEEEERTMFTVAKRDLNPEILIVLASDYLDRCKNILDSEIAGSRRQLNERLIQRGL